MKSFRVEVGFINVKAETKEEAERKAKEKLFMLVYELNEYGDPIYEL